MQRMRSINYSISLGIIITILGMEVSRADCLTGADAIHDGDIKYGLNIWRGSGLIDSLFDQRTRVFYCLQESGIAKSDTEIISWLEHATSKGIDDALLILATHHYASWDHDMEDIGPTEHWIEVGIEKNIADIKYLLGELYLNNRYHSKNQNDAIKLMHEAAIEGSIPAQRFLENIYSNGGYGYKKDVVKSKYWHEKINETANILGWPSLEESYANLEAEINDMQQVK